MTQSETALKRTPLHAAHVKAGRPDGPVRRLGHARPVHGHHRGAPRGARAPSGSSTSATWASSRSAGPDALARAPAAHHQRRLDARGRPGPVLAPLLPGRRDRRRPDAVPARRRPLHAHGQRLQHRQGLGVGRPRTATRRRRVDERERGDGADRGAGAAGRGARRTSGRRGRDGDRLLPLRAAARWRACRRSSPARATRARTASSCTCRPPAPRRLWERAPRRGQAATASAAHRARRARHAAARDEVRALRQRHRRDHESARGGARLGGQARQGRVHRPRRHRGVRAAGLRRASLVGFEMVERAVARHGYPSSRTGAAVGVVTSGSFGPSVEQVHRHRLRAGGTGRRRHRARRRDPRPRPARPVSSRPRSIRRAPRSARRD